MLDRWMWLFRISSAAFSPTQITDCVTVVCRTYSKCLAFKLKTHLAINILSTQPFLTPPSLATLDAAHFTPPPRPQHMHCAGVCWFGIQTPSLTKMRQCVYDCPPLLCLSSLWSVLPTSASNVRYSNPVTFIFVSLTADGHIWQTDY